MSRVAYHDQDSMRRPAPPLRHPRQRHTTQHCPCPLCGGWDNMDRGKGERCHGFTVGDWTHCSRDELAGKLPLEKNNTYAHRMTGPCGCGVEHGSRPAPISTGRTLRRRSVAQETPGRVVATYAYHDEAGVLRYEVLRYEPKTFRQRRPDGRGGWVWNLDGVRRVLYRLPELLAAPADARVFVCAGEKDTDRLRAAGLVATTNSEGEAAGKWQPEYAEALAGRRVVVLVDNDATGIAHGEDVAGALADTAKSVQVVRLPGLPPKGDVSDWLDAGHTVAELLALVDVWPLWLPPAAGAQLDRCERCEASEAKAARAVGRAEAAEKSARERLQFLSDIAELVADASVGEEARLWVALAIAHYRNDPALQPMTGNRWRLPQKLAARLCGRNVKTAGSYAVKLAERGALPLGPEERKAFVKADGHKAEPYILTYQWPAPAPADAPATAAANQPTLVSRSRRLAAQRARREARGDIRRLACPAHPHARVKLRRHCSVCNACLEPRGENIAATVPAARPDREPLQSLERFSTYSIQSWEPRPSCERCGAPLPTGSARCRQCSTPPPELLADLAALPEGPPEPLQTLERLPRPGAASTPAAPACVECGGPLPGPQWARCGPCLTRIATARVPAVAGGAS